MAEIYGPAYAAAYNASWFEWGGADLTPFLVEIVRAHHPGAMTWLDLCCGPGHLLQQVGEAGFAATGADASPAMIEHARRNAPAAVVHACDVLALDLDAAFDVVSCIGGSVNYFTRKRDLERLLRRARRHLAPAGWFIFDVNLACGFEHNAGRRVAALGDDHAVIVEIAYQPQRRRGQWRVTGFAADGKCYHRYEEVHVLRAYTQQEVEAALDQLGFSYMRYDGHSLDDPDETSGRIVYFGQPG